MEDKGYFNKVCVCVCVCVRADSSHGYLSISSDKGFSPASIG